MHQHSSKGFICIDLFSPRIHLLSRLHCFLHFFRCGNWGTWSNFPGSLSRDSVPRPQPCSHTASIKVWGAPLPFSLGSLHVNLEPFVLFTISYFIIIIEWLEKASIFFTLSWNPAVCDRLSMPLCTVPRWQPGPGYLVPSWTLGLGPVGTKGGSPLWWQRMCLEILS